MRHAICFVEDDDLERGAGVFVLVMGRRVRELLTCEVFDFFADDTDAAFVGGVELQDARAKHLWAVELFGKGEDGGGLSGAWGAVEEHVGELRRVSFIVG